MAASVGDQAISTNQSPLKGAVLGLLVQGPSYGYELVDPASQPVSHVAGLAQRRPDRLSIAGGDELGAHRLQRDGPGRGGACGLDGQSPATRAGAVTAAGQDGGGPAGGPAAAARRLEPPRAGSVRQAHRDPGGPAGAALLARRDDVPGTRSVHSADQWGAAVGGSLAP